MKLIDNVTSLFGDDLKANLTRTTKLKIMASYFSIYAYSALKAELEKIEELQFIFTSPTFVPEKVTERLKKEKREFIIPKSDRENSLYGTEYEIHLRNRLTPMIAPASTLVLFNKNIANFTHKRWENQCSKSFGFCDRTFS